MIWTDVVLTLLGVVVGILAGLLGVGGGIVVIPALVFVLPLFHVVGYTVHEATGISALQGFLGGTASLVTHARRGAVVPRLVTPLIVGGLGGGFLGGLVSGMVPAFYLYLVFAVVLVTTLVFAWLMPSGKLDTPGAEEETFAGFGLWSGLLVSGGISFLSANIGIGGSVLLLPILIYLKRVPMRLAIGTGAAMVVLTAASSVVGKWMIHLVPFPDALWVSLGAIVGGVLGARLSHKLPSRFLQRLLLILVSLALLRVLYEMIALVWPTP